MQGFEGDGWDCQGTWCFPLTKETIIIILLTVQTPMNAKIMCAIKMPIAQTLLEVMTATATPGIIVLD